MAKVVKAPKPKVLIALGLMSGTSMDGIDVAMIETDGETVVRPGPSATYPYEPEFRASLAQALVDAKAMQRRDERPGVLRAVERELTERHARAVQAFMAQCGMRSKEVDVIGFHGQTVLHRPWVRVLTVQSMPGTRRPVASFNEESYESRLTMQLGDGPLLARLTGRDVVYDLRAADVEAGGQGAPLAPVYHQAIAARLPQRPVAFLNIGGVANITWSGNEPLAFDTGPGNALLDDWAQRHTGKPCDEGGRLAAAGQVDEAALARLLADPYFRVPPPKSLDRNAFKLESVAHLSPADGAATLTAFTARAVRKALDHLPQPPDLWVICGGGRRNPTLMMALAEVLDGAVVPAEAIGQNGDSLEAEAWAYLAVRSLRGLPISFPGTTGVYKPMTGGVLARAPRRRSG